MRGRCLCVCGCVGRYSVRYAYDDCARNRPDVLYLRMPYLVSVLMLITIHVVSKLQSPMSNVVLYCM